MAALMLTASGDSRPGDFRIIGPGGGGAMFHPSISPHDPNTVVVSCDMTGSYITHDAGKSWRMFNLRGVVEFFVFDPLDRKVIYAQSNGLWRSQDEGETWSLVYPSPSSVKSIKMSSDHWRIYPDWLTSCGSILTQRPVLGWSSLRVHISLKRRPRPACTGYQDFQRFLCGIQEGWPAPHLCYRRRICLHVG